MSGADLITEQLAELDAELALAERRAPSKEEAENIKALRGRLGAYTSPGRVGVGIVGQMIAGKAAP